MYVCEKCCYVFLYVQVVYLATQIEVCLMVEKALKNVSEGDTDDLQNIHDKLTALIESAALMLRGKNRNQFATCRKSKFEDDKDLSEVYEETMWGARRSIAASENTRDLVSEADVSSQASAHASSKQRKSTADSRMTQIDSKSLLPSHIQKITNLVALLSHQREFVRKLLTMAQTQPGMYRIPSQYAFFPFLSS